MSWTSILVPHDFSPSALYAMAVARDEALLHNSRIVLFHALDLNEQLGMGAMMVPESVGPPISVRDYAILQAESQLDQLVRDLEGRGLVASRVVRIGYPSEEILAYAEEEGISLIVMGTHGRTGVRHLIIGSVAERVIRASLVPVLVVRQLGRDEVVPPPR